MATRRRRRQGRAVLSRSPETSPRWLHKHAFRRALTVRPHHPRAVEHRDCPPCGGDGVISHGIGRWGWMAPDPAAGFVVSFECAREISSRGNPDSAEFGHQALSSSGLTRGSCFLTGRGDVARKQDPRVEPEDDTVGLACGGERAFVLQLSPCSPRLRVTKRPLKKPRASTPGSAR